MNRPSIDTQMDYIRNLRAVRDAVIKTTRDGKPIFVITLNSPVVKHPAGKNFKLPAVQYTFNLESFGETLKADCHPADGTDGPLHPHFHATYHAPCWGSAMTPLREAFDRKDWMTFTHVLVAFACTYNHSAPYTTLDRFEMTNEEIGWSLNV